MLRIKKIPKATALNLYNRQLTAIGTLFSIIKSKLHRLSPSHRPETSHSTHTHIILVQISSTPTLDFTVYWSYGLGVSLLPHLSLQPLHLLIFHCNPADFADVDVLTYEPVTKVSLLLLTRPPNYVTTQPQRM